jgi:polysaccharide biosynthesis transport protein
MSRPHTPAKKGLDFAAIVFNLLSLTQHIRLMCILAVLGGMAGVIAYSYSVPMYYSRSMLSWHVFGLPFHDDSETKGAGPSLFAAWRDLKIALEADQLVKLTAVKLGVAKPEDDMDVVKSQIRMPRILFRDHQNLMIELHGATPEIVRDYPQALVEAYHENQASARREHREKSLARYLGEIDQLKSKVDSELKRKLDLEESSGMVSLTLKQERLLKLPAEIERSKLKLGRMDAIKENFRVTEGKLDLVGKLALLSSFEKESAEEKKVQAGDLIKRAPTAMSPFTPAAPPPTSVDVVVLGPQIEEGSVTWRNLEKEARALREEIRQTGLKFLPGHESMVKLTTRLSEVEHQLQAELDVALNRFEAEFTAAEARRKELEQQFPEYHDTIKKYEQNRSDYALLAKGQEDWSNAHADLSKRIAAIQFGEQKQQLEILFDGYEVLDDKVPVTPTTGKALTIGLALALGLAAGVPIAIEYINTTVSRMPQLEDRLGLRGLGIVPVASTDMLENIFRAPALGAKIPNYLLECFRIVRSNILLATENGGRSKVVAVTSARPSEGKSTMASNLAWAFFSMGERTLLIDCDLRRGRVHNIVGIDNDRGLSGYFAGSAMIGEIIQKTGNPKLDVISRGEFIPGASEFLCRSVFSDMITLLSAQYERIILDCPPVLGLSETVAIQRVADGVVLVVRAESTKTMDVDATVDQLRRGGAKFFGFVLNRLDLSKASNHYSYYYYSPDYYTTVEAAPDPDPVSIARA